MKLKKRDWLVIIIALATPWVFDFILKRSALSLPESGLHYGPFHLELYFNKGIILWLFSRYFKLFTSGLSYNVWGFFVVHLCFFTVFYGGSFL